MEEHFDVVDEQDRVIRSAPRSDVHRHGWRHRAVHMFVFRGDGALLIHLRSAAKEEFPSVWTSSASGHVAAGESYEVAAMRELQEELGISGSLEFLSRFDACPETSMEFTQLYSTCSDESVTVDRGEITEIRWLPPSEIAEWMHAAPDQFSPAFRLLFEWYRRHVS